MSLVAPLQRFGMTVVIMAMVLLAPMVVSGFDSGGSRSKTEMDKIKAGSKTLVVLGASYAGGWDPKRPVAGYKMVNKGVGGQQSFEMLARFEGDVLGLKPDAVIIWGFINDVFRSDRAQIDQTLRQTRESILAMVKLARAAGVTPILATEITIRPKAGWLESVEALIGRVLGKSSYQDYVNGHVLEANRWIRDLTVHEGLLLLDFERVLADQHGVRRKDFSQPDGSHVSMQGYEALSQYTEDRLKASVSIR